MKIKLTPELAYIIGMWSTRKSWVGVGVRGLPHVCDFFIQAVIGAGLMPSSKILLSGKKAYFYHSGYKRFFSDIEREMDLRFKHKNAYSAAFVAGIFDASGRIDKNGVPIMTGIGLDKQLLIERLGFRLIKEGKYLIPSPPREFLTFIKPHSQALRSGNERDPRP